MLVEFRVLNHRSLRTEQALTFESSRSGSADDGVTPPDHKLLTVAALYGANASGKSNVLAALNFMRDAVYLSHRIWEPNDGVPRDPFAWGVDVHAPSLFEVTLNLNGVRYQYGFVADNHRFLEEWLYAWPRGRKQKWFTRDRDSFKFGEHFSGENELVRQVTRPNALFLSAGVQHRHGQLAPIYNWFHSIGLVNMALRERHNAFFAERWLARNLKAQRVPAQGSLFGDDERDTGGAVFQSFMDLLRAADMGIVDLRLESDEVGGDRPPFSRSRVSVRHAYSTGDAWLSLSDESRGTLAMFAIGPVLLTALHRGGLVVVDELEASLHPLLALHIVRIFGDPSQNPHNAQLLFATHDTHLLGTIAGETPLRRDQVWLTEKDNEGATCVYPLTDYKPRKDENLERGYLQGRYGAIPFLGALAPVSE